MTTISNGATGTIAIQHSVPKSSVPAYINQVFDGGLTGYYLVKSVVDCFNDSCRLPIFSQYRTAQDKTNPYFQVDSALVTKAPGAKEVADAAMLEALLKPAVSAFANENHITFAQAAGFIGSAVDTLVAYNRVDGDNYHTLMKYEGVLGVTSSAYPQWGSYDLEDANWMGAGHYTMDAKHLVSEGQSAALVGAIFSVAHDFFFNHPMLE